ncbi:hypothetical protein [Bradyrhizobium sp. CCBAU 53338]|uniref:hypothetical protein n=1 Tax=Bradyrhizobium sp. CCBAU 53338 TaxID=1325111 RepID=UPI00188B3688|nr:hypothetical protein [Bradyrhizobium sp. CCBAU 53338]QOZ52541.1 hypothetical protein XH90_15035 [Bradyrhizobium sp. CCBAU 53338]
MAKFTQVKDRGWITEKVVGHTIDRCKMWYDGEGVSVSLVKMPAKHRLDIHRHETWVSVLSYLARWCGRARKRNAFSAQGDYYFVEPGEVHIETSVNETIVLITKAEPNIQYPIDASGKNIGASAPALRRMADAS